MKIIAFTGSMGSGKTTAIQELLASHRGDQVNVKFAQPLYDMQEYAYGRIDSVYTRPTDFVKDRKLLQWIGTEWGRDTISKTLWVDLWKAEVEKYKLTDTIVTCDDVRFDNEAETIRSLSGIIIRLETNQARIAAGNGSNTHSSEAGISNQFVKFTVHNNGSLEEFKNNLRTVYREIGLLK